MEEPWSHSNPPGEQREAPEGKFTLDLQASRRWRRPRRLQDGLSVVYPKVGSAPDLADDVDTVTKAAAEGGRISRFREETRDERMRMAREGQQHFGRAISWGAEIGDTQHVFTNLSTPVMTRLRQAERTVLDTLVDSGVARSRSDALAWCVKLVGTNADDWLLKLRNAMESVETIRRQGPLA